MTRTIDGHTITLGAGVSYEALRPGFEPGRGTYPVTIRHARGPGREVLHTIENLTWGEADSLVRAFNNRGSFEGRAW